jgi:hypothetical protein
LTALRALAALGSVSGLRPTTRGRPSIFAVVLAVLMLALLITTTLLVSLRHVVLLERFRL